MLSLNHLEGRDKRAAGKTVPSHLHGHTVVKVLRQQAESAGLENFPLICPHHLKRFRANGSHDSQLPDCPRTEPGVRFSRTGLFTKTCVRNSWDFPGTIRLTHPKRLVWFSVVRRCRVALSERIGAVLGSLSSCNCVADCDDSTI